VSHVAGAAAYHPVRTRPRRLEIVERAERDGSLRAGGSLQIVDYSDSSPSSKEEEQPRMVSWYL
jgi:hypothetical protein